MLALVALRGQIDPFFLPLNRTDVVPRICWQIHPRIGAQPIAMRELPCASRPATIILHNSPACSYGRRSFGWQPSPPGKGR